MLGDTWQSAVWSQHLRTPALPAFARGFVGSARFGDRLAPLRAEPSRHAPLTFRGQGGSQYAPPQIIGYVTSLDLQVLLDG